MNISAQFGHRIGAPHRALGELEEFIRGHALQKSDFRPDGTPAIHYGQVHTVYDTWISQTKSYVDPSLAQRLRRARTGDLVIATTSEDDHALGKAIAWLGQEEAAVSGDAYIYRHRLEPRYVAYFFQTSQFHEQKRRAITGTKVRRLSGEALSKIIMPVPPLEVQHAISDVLDKFRALEAELEAELEARHQQYSHYRDQLLRFGGGVDNLG